MARVPFLNKSYELNLGFMTPAYNGNKNRSFSAIEFILSQG